MSYYIITIISRMAHIFKQPSDIIYLPRLTVCAVANATYIYTHVGLENSVL